jgi:hypothetical protein
LVLSDDAHGLKAIFEAIHTVPELPAKTIEILGHAIEFLVPLQRTRLELENCLGIMGVWRANFPRVARVATIANRPLSASPQFRL